MDYEMIVKDLQLHVNGRIEILKVGGVFQRKALNELFQVKEILDRRVLTEREKSVMSAPPQGSAEPVNIRQRSKEIYDREVAAGHNPENWRGDTNPGGANKRPCPKKQASGGA